MAMATTDAPEATDAPATINHIKTINATVTSGNAGDEAVGPAAPAEPMAEPEPRSILNAASDSSDAEDAESNDAQLKAAADDEDEDVLPPIHGEKGKTYTVSDLFVNDNLRRKSANAVLKKDPFAIPRATDNVTEYRPRFNPLSILVSEEKLLPQNFTFDFSEGIPGVPRQSSQSASAVSKKAKDASESGDADTSSGRIVRKSVAPIRNPQHFGDKLSTMGLLMGSMPRQAQPSPLPLINTPTVHNPFGEPLLELVATNEPPLTEPATFQRVQPVPHAPLLGAPLTPSAPALMETLGGSLDLDVLGMDINNISGLSKLSIAASADPTIYHSHAYPGYGDNGARITALPPQTPPPSALYDGLANYLPNHFAEKRISNSMGVMAASLYEVPPYHGDGQMIEDDEDFRDSFEEDYATSNLGGRMDQYNNVPQQSPVSVSDQHHHHQQQPVSPTMSTPSQSLQPISKKPRSKNVFRPCTTPGCTKGARGKSGLCQKHGGGKRCATADCPKGAQGSSKYCLFHGGGYRCTVPGCSTGARGTSGLCAKHGGYKRAREGSEDGQPESRDESGQATKNPRLDFEGRALAESA